MKKMMFTHYDLDGVSCAMQFPENFFVKIRAIMYSNIEQELHQQLNGLNEPHTVYVTDINMTTKQLEFVLTHKNVNRVVYIDHHQYNNDQERKDFDHLRELYPESTIIVNHSACGAKLVFQYAEKFFEINKNQKSYVDIVDIFDRWQTENPLFMNSAIRMNDLYWAYGFENFKEKFKDFSGFGTEENRKLLTTIEKNRKTEIMDIFENKSTTIGDFVFIHFTPSNLIDYYSFFSDHHCYLMAKKIENGKIFFSVRIKKDPEITLENFQYLSKIDGFIIGGHPKTFGMSCREDQLELIVTEFDKVINYRK